MCPARPSLHWVPAVPGSPASAVLWRAPIPRHPSRRTSYSFAWRYHGASLGNAGRERRVPACAEFSGPRTVRFRGDVEASQVPGESLCACPARETPARSATPRQVRCAEVAFRRYNAVGPRGSSCSRGSVTRPTHSLSTLRSTGRPSATQDSLPAGCLALTGRVLSPRDSSRSFRFSSFPSSRLGLAQCTCRRRSRRCPGYGNRTPSSIVAAPTSSPS